MILCVYMLTHSEEIVELRLVFLEFLFSYTNRVCNKVAHVLAKYSGCSHVFRSSKWYD